MVSVMGPHSPLTVHAAQTGGATACQRSSLIGRPAAKRSWSMRSFSPWWGLVVCGLAFAVSTQIRGVGTGLARDFRGPGRARPGGWGGNRRPPSLPPSCPPNPPHRRRAMVGLAVGEAASMLGAGGPLGVILWRRFRKRLRARALHSDPAGAAPAEAQDESIDAWIFAETAEPVAGFGGRQRPVDEGPDHGTASHDAKPAGGVSADGRRAAQRPDGGPRDPPPAGVPGAEAAAAA